jgi:hypothetical protein
MKVQKVTGNQLYLVRTALKVSFAYAGVDVTRWVTAIIAGLLLAAIGFGYEFFAGIDVTGIAILAASGTAFGVGTIGIWLTTGASK